jgi:hypothetical protein
VATFIGPIGDARAESNASVFNLVADASAVWVEFHDNGLPLTSTVGTGPLTSQATVSSLGSSTGFAAMPYLGSFLQTTPGTANGLLNGALPVTNVPGFVTSNYPGTPEQSQSAGPYLVRSESGPVKTRALAQLDQSQTVGSPARFVHAVSDAVANEDGTVQVTASSGADGVQLGPLALASISSQVTMSQRASEAPIVTRDIELGTFTVAGIKVGVDNTGAHAIAGNDSPTQVQALTDQVNSALRAAGVSVRLLPDETTYVPGTKTVKSITAGGLQIRIQSSDGARDLTYTFGRVAVLATNVRQPGLSSPGSQPTAGVAGPAAAASPVDSAGVTSSLPVVGGTSSVPTVTLSKADGLSATKADLVSQESAGGQETDGRTSLLSWYLLLAVAAVAALGGAHVFRLLGVRRVWPRR